MAIERTVKGAIDAYFKSPQFHMRLRRHVKWAIQGFAPGFKMKDRERFTETVAFQIHQKARRPVYLFGYRVWRRRERRELCAQEAERIVTEFLDSEKIKFGDPAYSWNDGRDLADEDLEYWESC